MLPINRGVTHEESMPLLHGSSQATGYSVSKNVYIFAQQIHSTVLGFFHRYRYLIACVELFMSLQTYL